MSTLLHFSWIRRHTWGDVDTKEYEILTHEFYIILNIYNNSHKYNAVGIMASKMLTHSFLTSTDVPFFTIQLYVFICTNIQYRRFGCTRIKSLCRVLMCPVQQCVV